MANRKTYYLTTPIYYVNDVPHPGHAYTTVAADALARAHRLQSRDAFFLTGTDEHGQNIERIAREKGVRPQEYCDGIASVFKALWDRLLIRYDRFIRTTDEVHKRGVLKLWGLLRSAEGPDGRPVIYRDTYAGWYCPRCEGFKTEDELKQPGNLCPDHERASEWTEEENLFFRLSAYEGWLREEIESGRLLIEPAGRRNEVLAVVRQGLKDFSVSRARVKWGIPVPDDPGHVFYVWMDALANYVTALGFADDSPDYRRFWAEAGERLHFVGKEIIRFHCLYWPAMLKAAGLPVPSRVFAHGWLTKGGKKLSKSTGNIISPDDLIDRFGPDAFRYFFLREGSFGQDWDFTEDAFVRRFNADLANDLGNLVSRALTMVARYCEGKLPARPAVSPSAMGIEARLQREEELAARLRTIFVAYDALDYAGALSAVWGWIAELNQRIVVEAPWELAKDPVRRPELEAFLYRLLEAIRLLATLAGPVIPNAACRIFAMLGLSGEPGPQDLAWGRLEPGKPLGKIEPLFPRVENKEKSVTETKVPATSDGAAPPAGTAGPAPAAAGAAMDGRIDIAEFARVELRVAQILEAEKVQGSKKLIRLQVDLGTEKRQVVAGIAESYAAEALVGRKVALVVNLKPAKLMGVESNGMVLAASLEGKAVLLQPDADVPVGTKIR
ncbi:MAG TPA: methionine--tRNA ligase [Vicinamibacteria bacterium]|nr:methionine--tRNA ligase [Vicinamibacteria bacterium]